MKPDPAEHTVASVDADALFAACDDHPWGRGTRLCAGRHRGPRRRRSVGAPARLARRGTTATWTTWPRHAALRADPTRLLPGACSVISAHGLPAAGAPSEWAARELRRLDEAGAAVVSLYARGRDYHKVLRGRLQSLAERIEQAVGAFGYRVATDSRAGARGGAGAQARIGWRGKHTLLLSQDAGSMFFLGEILTDLPLPADAPISRSLRHLQRAASTSARRARSSAPYQLDARRCISYLTIEHAGPHSRGAAAADRQSHLRLRRLPAGLPVEQVCAALGAG